MVLIFRYSVSRGRDPNAVAVLLEDSAALAGILIATASIGLTSITGNVIFDAIGSISIGGLFITRHILIFNCLFINVATESFNTVVVSPSLKLCWDLLLFS